jgi:hypothetical protein
MGYDAMKELMSYYYFEFNINYILLAIIVLNTIKLIKDYLSIKKNIENGYFKFSTNYFDLVISTLAILGLWSGLMFQGVLSDISIQYSNIWLTKRIVISAISIVLYITQIILHLRFNIKYKRLKHK